MQPRVTTLYSKEVLSVAYKLRDLVVMNKSTCSRSRFIPIADAVKTIFEFNPNTPMVLRKFYIGKKNREIYEPTLECKKLIDAYIHIFRILGLQPMMDLHRFYGDPLNLEVPNEFKLNWQPNGTAYLRNRSVKEVINVLDVSHSSLIEKKANPVYFKFDIKSAFNSVTLSTFKRLSKYNEKFNLLRKTSAGSRKSKQLINDLLWSKLDLLFVDNKLPQGFGTSPYLFDIVQTVITYRYSQYLTTVPSRKNSGYCKDCYKLYESMSEAAPCALIRYVDDIIVLFYTKEQIPCKHHFEYLTYLTNRFYKRFGLSINSKKTAIMHSHKRTYIRFLGHSIAGNNVNVMTIPVKQYRKILKVTRKLQRNELTSAQDKSYLHGMRGYAKTVKLGYI